MQTEQNQKPPVLSTEFKKTLTEHIGGPNVRVRIVAPQNITGIPSQDFYVLRHALDSLGERYHPVPESCAVEGIFSRGDLIRFSLQGYVSRIEPLPEDYVLNIPRVTFPQQSQ